MNRSARLKTSEGIGSTTQQEKSVKALLVMLSSLQQIAEVAVDRDAIGADRMNELAGYMAEIRHLLGHLQPELYHPAVSEESRRLAARYRDLEGRVKELRNDRAGAMQ
jgi:hypothetical protein